MLLFQPADYNQCALLQERQPDECLASWRNVGPVEPVGDSASRR